MLMGAPNVRPLRLRTRSSILFLIIFTFQSAVFCDVSVDALLRFRISLLDSEASLASWDPAVSSPCSGNHGNWKGVICFNGYIWGLQLENMSLAGQIDIDALVPLRFLRTLSFMNNGFEGPMPEWRKLRGLKSLYLSNNKFSGQIQEDAFKGMTSLKKVHLANNKFTGLIPSSLESPKLIELRLENNQFTGRIPSISSQNLKVLNVSNNYLEGPIPEPLEKMDPSSFSGNKALCGKPLESECVVEPPLQSPPPSSSIPDSISPPAAHKHGKMSIGAIIAISVVVGLFLLVLLLLLYRKIHRKDQTPQLGREISHQKSFPVVVAAISDKKVEQPQQPGKLSFVRDDNKQKFELQDLMRASAEVLGSSKFGASYLAVLVEGEELVVKRFKQMNTVPKEDFHEHMRRLGRLEHPNLLPLVAYLYRREEKLLVFEYIKNGSLAMHLHEKRSNEKSNGLSWRIRLNIVKGVVKGLIYLHRELPSLTVPHGHLKSSNVLLDKDFNPILMDYSLVPVVNSSQVQDFLVAYKSPEFAHHQCTTKKTDVWCLGILILEVLTGNSVTKYLAEGSGLYGTELKGWINGIILAAEGKIEEALDAELAKEESCREEIEKLLKIGIACCQEEEETRWDLDAVRKQIEQVQEYSN